MYNWSPGLLALVAGVREILLHLCELHHLLFVIIISSVVSVGSSTSISKISSVITIIMSVSTSMLSLCELVLVRLFTFTTPGRGQTSTQSIRIRSGGW